MAKKNKKNINISKQSNAYKKNRHLAVGILAIIAVAGAILAVTFGLDRGASNSGVQVFDRYCARCHIAEGQGNPRGIDLTGIADKRDVSWLSAWIKDPKSINRAARMPGFDLDAGEMSELTGYLSTLK